jgi:TonB family protein
MAKGLPPLATLVALFAALGPAVAAAEEPAPPPASAAPVPPEAAASITRPVPLNTPAPLYPEGHTGDHAVAVELTVTEEGTVSDATILLGEPPFSDLALEAVRSWTFEPATRNGEPVAARIRFEVLFREPEPEPEAAPEPLPVAPAPVAPPPAPGEPVDVVVIGEREAPERVSMSRAEVREIPGTFGDPFRGVEVMPGVTPLATGLPYFYVRGAPPGNVGYYLDNIRVPLLYHFALGPSVIHPGIVDRVDLYSGAYPARYGRYSGGIVAAETTAPRPSLHGEANVRLFDAGALLEGPVANDRGIVLAAGRYSYTGGILSLVAPEVTLGYWDYQLRASYEVTDRDRLGVFAFGSYDFFAVEEADNEDGLGTEFHRVDLRHERRIDSETQLKSAITLGYDRTAQETLDNDSVNVLDLSIGARSRLEHRSSAQELYRAGLDINFDSYTAKFDDDAEEDFPTRLDYAVGVFAELIWEPERWMQITPGVRVDLYGSGSHTAVGVDPRISARYQLSRRVALRNALGIAHQPPSFVVPIPGFALGGLEDGLQRALQSSAGVDVLFDGDVSAEVTVFQNAFFELTDLLSLVQSGELDDDADLETRLRGQSYGFEIMVRRPLTEKLGGFFSYTLSRSQRSLDGYRFTASFDRTHVLHAALAYDLGRRWRAGTRFTFYTGVPAELEYTLTVDSTGQRRVLPPPDRGIRAPSFYRLDIRLEKKWPIGTQGAWWSFIFEIINTTLHKETLTYRCNQAGCRGDEFGPVTIPSVGVEAAF